MKTKQELIKAITAMVLITESEHSKDSEKQHAKRIMDVLLWVGGYPNKFHKVVDGVEALHLPIEQIEADIEKACLEWMEKHPEDYKETAE